MLSWGRYDFFYFELVFTLSFSFICSRVPTALSTLRTSGLIMVVELLVLLSIGAVTVRAESFTIRTFGRDFHGVTRSIKCVHGDHRWGPAPNWLGALHTCWRICRRSEGTVNLDSCRSIAQ